VLKQPGLEGRSGLLKCTDQWELLIISNDDVSMGSAEVLNNKSQYPSGMRSSKVKQSYSCAHLEGILGSGGTAQCICNLGTEWE
jgi:hypothetical protein